MSLSAKTVSKKNYNAIGTAKSCKDSGPVLFCDKRVFSVQKEIAQMYEIIYYLYKNTRRLDL